MTDHHPGDYPHCARIIRETGDLMPTGEAIAELDRIMREGQRVDLTDLTNEVIEQALSVTSKAAALRM